MNDLHLGAGTDGDGGELEGDVAADEDEAPGQLLQIQELLTGGQQLLAGYAEVRGFRTGRDDDVARAQLVVVRGVGTRDIHARRAGEPRHAVIWLDARLGERGLIAGRGRVGESALEALEVRPGNAQVGRDESPALQPSDRRERVGHAHQHLFRVAAAQLARAAEGAAIHDGDAPASLAAGIGNALRGRAGAQHDEIEITLVSH
jgi:hypothetical protein